MVGQPLESVTTVGKCYSLPLSNFSTALNLTSHKGLYTYVAFSRRCHQTNTAVRNYYSTSNILSCQVFMFGL